MLKTFSGRRASQDEFELNSFVEFLIERGVQNYCEIGARDGDTFHDIMQKLGPSAKGLALDLPGGLWGKKTTCTNLCAAVKDLKSNGHDVDFLFADSRLSFVVDAVACRGPWDCILIDGDHTYAGVSDDWNNYRHFAPLIAFHDIVGADQFEKATNKRVEVPRLWAEIKADHSFKRDLFEFISPESKMGIGVVSCA